MLRYLRGLADRDLALDRAMIPLGSCTMKLNATSEMIPVTWRAFAHMHPFAPGRPGRRLPRDDRRPRAHAVRGDRLRRGVAAAERRLAGRVRGPADDPRVARVARRGPPRRLPDPRVRARHQPRFRADGGDARRRRGLRRRRQRRPRRSRGEGGEARARARGDHGDLSVDARRVRDGHHAAVRDRARARRAGVRRRREPQRARRPRAARAASAPTCRTSTCTRRSASRTAAAGRAWARSRAGRTSRPTCRATATCRRTRQARARRGRRSARCPRRRSARASILPIPWMYVTMMGGERPRRRDRERDPRGELPREAPRAALPGAVQRPRRARRARVHPRPASAEGGVGRRGGGRRQAADRLRLPRADDELPGAGHADGRADREREQARARPLRRRDDRDPRRDPRDRVRTPGPRRQPAQARAAHGRGRRGRRVDACVHAARRPAGRRSRTRASKYWPPVGRVDNVYGDRNLFCSCIPVPVDEDTVAPAATTA